MKKSFRDAEKSGSFHLRKTLNKAELKSKAKKSFPFKHTKTLPTDLSFHCVDNNPVLLYCFLITQSLSQDSVVSGMLISRKSWNGRRAALLHHIILSLHLQNTFFSECF